MSNLTIPAGLPGCGQPATVRFEAYSPAGTLHGSLDVALNVCPDHGAAAVKAIIGAGFTAHSINIPEPSHLARCGSGYDFTASRPLVAPEIASAADAIEPGDDFSTGEVGHRAADLDPADMSTIEALHRLAERLADAERAVKVAFAKGYVDGVAARLRGEAGHAWTVTRDDAFELFVWTCRCGRQEYQPFDEQPPEELRIHPLMRQELDAARIEDLEAGK